MFHLLRGLRIIDLTTVALGPYATQILGDFGADVIKVESSDGDIFRAPRPGPRADLGAGFMNYNRNKRSIVLNLKLPAGQDVLKRLVRDADVLVHNMRSHSAARLGASYEQMKAINPTLVYCYSPGFGGRGPDADAPAYDDIIQARSGLAALNADSDGVPQFVRTIACDKVVGLHLALAVMGGVISRERNGEGSCIEAPMLESMVSFLMSEHLAGHTLIPPVGDLGYDRLMTRNRRPFRTRDGYLAILPYSTKHWVRFFTVCGREDWANSEMVTNASMRSEHIDELYGRIAEAALTRTTAEWQQILADQDIPAAPVSSLSDLFSDAHLTATDMFREVNDEKVGQIREIRSPFEVDGKLAHQDQPGTVAPGLGEHTDEVLTEAGYQASEIKSLREAGAIG